MLRGVVVATGDLVAGRYRVRGTLGSGGMAVVYRAHDERLARDVALKVLAPSVSHDPRFEARFRGEAAAMARLNHENVLSLFDFGEHDGTVFLVMPLVIGTDLRQELTARRTLPLARTVELVRQVAAGLDAAHRSGRVHRDVKPANILLEQPGQPRERALVADFGLVQDERAPSGLTSFDTVVGTAAYMAPERFRGHAATASADVYALAAVAYECLAGQPVFAGASSAELGVAHLSAEPPDLCSLAPAVPRAVAEVIAGGLAKDVEARPTSAGEFAVALARATETAVDADTGAAARVGDTAPLPVVAPVAPDAPPATAPPQSSGPPVRPRRRAALGALAALVVVTAAGGAAVLASRGSDDPEAGPTRSVAPTPSLASAAAALQARLPVDAYSGCTAAPDRQVRGVVTALTCRSPIDGVDEVLVNQWKDRASMLAEYSRTAGARPDGTCGTYTGTPTAGLRSTWGSDGDQPLSCYVNVRGAAVVAWEYPDEALQLVAVRADRNATELWAWWTRAAALPVG